MKLGEPEVCMGWVVGRKRAVEKAEFEAKLARSATHNRPQYLRIKAIALDGAGLTDDALTLLIG